MNDRVQVHETIVNGVEKTNGVHEPHSPISPVDIVVDQENQDPESNVRSEPLKPLSNSHALKDASLVPQVASPQDPDSIPIDPPTGTPPPPTGELLEEVRIAENQTPDISQPLNGSHTNGVDVVMGDHDDHTPVTTPGLSSSATADSIGVSTSHTTPNEGPGDEEDGQRPAKRARVHSDADRASIAHKAHPPPTTTDSMITDSVSTPQQPQHFFSSSEATLNVQQYRFCQSTIRTLKKMKDAGPFLRPVDPVALNIPHYPSIIKNPMDFSTVERKLTASNPAKPDSNPANPRYSNADEFIADIRLIFQNCVAFNGPDHVVTAMGRRVEEVFDKQIKNLPPAESPKPVVVKKQSTPPRPIAAPPPPVPVAKKTQQPRRPSTSVPVIRRSDAQPDPVGRPKREIHPPPPKDLAYADAPKKPRKSRPMKDDGTIEQLKFCHRVLADLHKKQYYHIANPFYEPVDWVKLEIPSYPKVIKRPMDLSTMRRKLEQNEYSSAEKFADDFKLMIRNCFHFNPAGTPVNQAGIELQRLFDEKWRNLPKPHQSVSDDEDDVDEDSENDHERQIQNIEREIESLRGTLTAIKQQKDKKKKKEKKEKPPVPSTSKAVSKPPKASSGKKKTKKNVTDDDVLSFEQKKDLSEAIATLEGSKLERVIQIIHEGVPEIRDSTEEIELEIDTLPAPVLTKLYNFVIRPMKAAPPKRNRPGKGTGTGGLKRKSMDEDVEAEKIRQLEQRMALFEQGTSGAASAPVAQRHDSDQSSDSSSDSDSGSDSD
ncbi:transcription initiation at TATA-containing promoter protein [Paramarasmius palmivorus]|uniref:Transcription initiation at TATA-containing promoter protein n=1 Tax=Paramarasmius palmivorus TaxID=297713 RepID=A0AAW0E3X2_9AGAR